MNSGSILIKYCEFLYKKFLSGNYKFTFKKIKNGREKRNFS